MRILYIASHYNPFIPQTGSGQRYNLLLQALVRIGYVDVVSFQSNAVSNISNCRVVFSENIPTDILSGRWRKFKRLLHPLDPYTYFPISKQRAKIVSHLVEHEKYDLIVTRYVDKAFECGLMRYADKLVIDVDDYPVDVWMTLSRNATSIRASIYYKICATFIKWILPSILKRVRYTFFPNKKQLIGRNSSYLPNVPFYEMSSLERNHIIPNSLLFVGDLRYTPNILGIEHFLKEIFPKIRNRIFDAQLYIVGRNNGKDWATYQERQEGVHVLGFVSDIEKAYAQASICVVPIYSGAGTNIKVLEALQAGRACVVSKEATRGFSSDLQDGEDYYVANTDKQFVNYVCELLQNKDKNVKIALSGSQKVHDNYSKQRFYMIVEKSLINETKC